MFSVADPFSVPPESFKFFAIFKLATEASESSELRAPKNHYIGARTDRTSFDKDRASFESQAVPVEPDLTYKYWDSRQVVKPFWRAVFVLRP